MQGIKSSKLEISNLALYILCMELDFFRVQVPSFEVFRMRHNKTFSKICLSFFKSRSKIAFSQYLAFPFLLPSVLLSYQHHLKAKFRMYFAQPSFGIFEWCGQCINQTYYLYPVANTVRPSVDAGEMITPARKQEHLSHKGLA